MDILNQIKDFERNNGVESFLNYVDKFIVNNGQVYFNLIQDIHYEFFENKTALWIRFFSPYFSARIIGS